MEISLPTPYTYEGGNLLLDITVTQGGNYKSATFYGSSISGAGRYFYNTTEGAADFLPKTTFTYEAAATGTCPKPKSLSFSNIAARAADLSWNGGTASAWQICINGDEENLIDASSASYSFANLTPLTEYSVKVRAVCGEEQSDWSAASFTTLSACPYPITNLLISNLYTNSAIINFEEATGEAGAFEAELSTDSNFPEGNTTFFDAESDAFGLGDITFEGLIPATKYYVRMRAYCEDESTSGEWSSVFSFTTACETRPLPYSENFDAYSGTTDTSTPSTYPNDELPQCWSFLNRAETSGTYPQAFISSASGYVASGKCLFFKSSSSTPIYAVLPPFEENITALQLKFTYRNEGTGGSNGTLYVGYMTDPSDASTFTSLLTCTKTTTLTEKEVLFDEAMDGSYIAFMYEGISSNNYYLSIDNVIVRLAPNCSKLTSISQPTDITASSATFSWVGTESNYEYVIAEKDSTPDWSSPVAVDGASSVTVSSGLQPNTAYDFYVRSNCGDGDTNKGDALHVSFTTKCLAVSEFPWFEHFDSITVATSVLPDCWSKINTAISSSYSSYPYVYANGSYSTYAHSASNCLYFYTYYSTSSSYSGEDEYAILPQMSSLEGKRISFYAKGYNATSIIKVGTMSDPSDASTFAEIQSDTLTTSYEKYTVNLSGSNHYIALKVMKPTTTYSYSGAYVDDITVEDIPSCLEPTGLAFVEATANSAKFNLTAGGTETAWDFYYSTENVAPTAETVPQVVAAADTAISSGLNPNTQYYVWVRAHCSDSEQSPWSEGISFRSGCAPYEAASFTEDFEDGIYCWTVGNLQSEDGVSHVPYPYWKAAYNGENGLYMIAYKSYSTVHDSAYAVLPQMNYGEKSLKDFSISFYAQASNTSDNTHLILGVVADPADSLASFEQITQFDLTTSFDIYEYSFANYEGSKPYIVLLATLPEGYASSTSKTGEFYIDDIALFETPSCQPLRSISISDLARRSMVVNLEPKAGIALASEYELVYSTSELDEAALEAATKIAINDTNAYEINGLDRETLYYIYVRANCGGENGKSAWVSTSAKTKALSACDDVQVGNGSYNGYYAPIATYYKNSWVQFIYPASEIDQQAGMIGAISFYCSATDASTDLAGEVNIYMAHTSKSDHSSTSDWLAAEDLTLVYHTDAFEKPAATGWMSFDLNTAFAYNGTDNIAIVVAAKLPNYSTSIKFDYWPTDNALLYRGNDGNTAYGEHPGNNSGTRSNNRPNIKFSFCHELDACPAVSELTAAVLGIGTTQEKISWAISGADYLSGFDMIVSKTELDDEALATAEPTYSDIHGLSKDLENLDPSTDYYVYLRAICKAEGHDEGNSDWASVHFKTLADCPAVINLSLELGATDSITATWERATMEQAKEFKYILTKTRLDVENITAELNDVNDTVKAFNELDHAQKYYFYVASACGDATSAFVEDSIETLPACQAVENLAASRVEHNRVELAWTSAQLATETEWKVGIVGDPIPAQTVSERKAILFGLSAETAYEAYVIALCGEESVSDSAKVAFNTAAQPGACKQIGSGTSESNFFPTNAYFKYSTSEQIYTAAEVGKAGKILSLSFYSNGPENTRTIDVYVAHTTKSSFSSYSDWQQVSAADKVYSGSITFAANQWISIPFDNEFEYNGTDNLLVIVDDNTNSYCTSGQQTKFLTCTTDGYECLYINNDGTDVNPTASSSAYGTRSYSKNQIQFCFEAKAAPDVTALAISDITTNSAKASWEPMGSETAWNVFISPTQVTDFSDIVAERVETLSKSFTGLADDEDYFVYVQPAVEGAEYSMVSFRTIASCLIQTNPAVVAASITAHTARVTWVDPNEVKAGNYKVVYAKAAEFDLEDADLAFVESADTFAVLPALQADTVYKFAVMANCDGGEDESRYSAVASFATLKSCFTPYATTVIDSTITAYSATVYWKDDHDDAGYLVAYGLYDSFDLDNPETYLTKYVPDTFAVLEGLTAGESYKVSIKGDCSSVGEGQSKTWAPYAYFNTKCEAKALPYSEDFETQSSLVCWTVGNIQEERDSYSSYLSHSPGRSSSAKANGEYGLKIHAYKSTGYGSTDADSAYAVLPELVFGEDAITDYQIRFNAKAKIGTGYYSDYYYSHLLIGVAEDDALTNLAIIADTALSTSAFQEVELSFAAYTGTGNRIVLLARVDPSSTASPREAEIYVDDIHVSKSSACKRPTALAVSNITTDAAQLAWTENGEATAWQIRLNGDDEHLIDADANPFNLSALTAATAYSVEVRANCGGAQSDWSAPLNFATEICNEADKKAIRYEISDTYGDGWNGDAALKIVHKATNTEIASLTVISADSKTPVIGNLPLCCGEEYSIIWVSGSFDSECRFALYDINDDVIVEHTTGSPTAGTLIDYTMNCVVPTCSKPASVEVSDITSSSATFNWVAGNSETDFQYVVVAKDEAPDWSAATDVIGKTTALVESLEANKAYDFYVRANCGEEKSDPRSISFRTDCGVMALPFQEFFEDEIPCWTMKDCASNTNVSANAAYEGLKGFKFAYNTNPPQYLISPELMASEKKVKVSFFYKAGGTYVETFQVGYSTTTDATDAFTWAEEITASSTFEQYLDTLPDAGVKYVAIKYTANDQLSLYIDNFAVEEIGGTGTGIDAIGTESEKAVKFVKDDHIYILRNGILYDVTGRLIRK